MKISPTAKIFLWIDVVLPGMPTYLLHAQEGGFQRIFFIPHLILEGVPSLRVFLVYLIK
jgi:hypothetical protein